MLYHVTIEGTTHAVDIEGGTVTLDGEAIDARLTPLAGPHVHGLRIGPRHRRLMALTAGREQVRVQLDGRTADVQVVDERTRVIREMSGASASAAQAASVRAPMPGLVIKVEVEEGQTIKRGQGVAIVEAMKMENELSAESDARVVRILVAPGETVEKGQILVELEPIEPA